jgi:PiT family inorganic phosphate transporter
MVDSEILIPVVIILALLFTYTNGFQDGSSVAASGIASLSMSPRQAVSLVAVFEFIGAIAGGTAVATTIQSIAHWPSQGVLLPVLMSALVAAISWNFVTRSLGIPSSSTHALVGGILGAVAAAGGVNLINWGEMNQLWNATGVSRVICSLMLSPPSGFVAGYLFLNLFTFLLRRATMKANSWVQRSQWLAVSALAFGHGSNDPAKSMGLIILALTSAGVTNLGGVPFYIKLVTGIAMVLGVISFAQLIVKRVGTGIYKLRPLHALCSELASASILTGASLTGGPVSASQVIASSIMGVGAGARFRGVQWLVAKDMLLAWLLTIPCSGLLAALIHAVLLSHLSPVVK